MGQGSWSTGLLKFLGMKNNFIRILFYGALFLSAFHLKAQEIDTKITTFFMFNGQAEEAINFYISIFDDAEIKMLTRYGPDGPGKEGTVYLAIFTLEGKEYMAIDSAVKHDFAFNPAISLFVECGSEDELDRLFAALSKDGFTHMPLDNYGFSTKFGWCEDRFGVSWQLNLK